MIRFQRMPLHGIVVSVFCLGWNVQQCEAAADDLKWIDGRLLPIEGRAFDDTERYYDRLPRNVTTNVNEGVRSLKHDTAGMQFRFVTDSDRIVLKWVPSSDQLASDNLVQVAKSGIDVYRQDKNGTWLYHETGRIKSADGGELELDWIKGTPCLVNLPLYNGLKSFSLGIRPTASIKPLPPRKSGVLNPVVFYGTSITQGASASRPGLSFVNIIGRQLDVPVVNLGFSASGVMELEMCEHLARINASCYVLDCLWNMNKEMILERYEKFVRNLRAKRPRVPIVMAEQSDVYGERRVWDNGFTRRLYDKLIGEGWDNLVYLPCADMYGGNRDATIDGIHPNDLGMASMAKAFGGAIRAALKLSGGESCDARSAYETCYQAIDGHRIKERLNAIWRHEFLQTLPAKRRAAEQVVAFMKEDGLSDIEVIEIPVDGKTSFQDKKMPIGWDATVGKLTVTDYGNPDEIVEFAAPEQRVGPVVADYAVHPFHLIKGSVATPPGGIDARVVPESAFRRGEDVKGAFVILEPLTWPRYNVLGKLIDAGVAGFITDYLTGRFTTPDCLQWVTACTETHSWSPDEDTRPFLGFSVTPRVGTYLRTYANRGGLKVHAECDGRRYASTVPFVTATVPGRRKEEYWLIAHLYEPLATDDSNGVAAVLEIARMFRRGPQPEYTLRIGFGIEMYGYAAYTALRGTPIRDVLGGLNCDSVVSVRGHGVALALSGTPSFTSTVTDSSLADIVGAPHAPAMALIDPRTFDDDQFISDPTVGVPIDWPRRRSSGDKYWHNSVQSLEVVDEETIRRGAAFAAAVATLAMNPTKATLARSVRQAETNLVRLSETARNAEEFEHLAAFERRRLADFVRVLGHDEVDLALEAFDRRAASLAKTLKTRAEPLPSSPARTVAEGLVPIKTCTGFPQDLVRVPKAERVDLIGEYIYGPLVNIGINADGKKTLARLIREAEYERGFVADEQTVQKIVADVRFLAKWGYFSLNKN